MMNVLIMPVANYWASCHYSWMLNKKRQLRAMMVENAHNRQRKTTVGIFVVNLILQLCH